MFEFPLQRILELRAKREAEVARQLAQARSAADASRETRDALLAAQQEGQRQVAGAQSGPVTVGQMQSFTFVLAQLDERVALADEIARAAEAAVTRAHQELTVALQDRRVLDKLRDRRLEAYRAEESMRDQQTMDAIALTRFSQGAAASGGTDA
jgi:flagellar FliJ protein